MTLLSSQLRTVEVTLPSCERIMRPADTLMLNTQLEDAEVDPTHAGPPFRGRACAHPAPSLISYKSQTPLNIYHPPVQLQYRLAVDICTDAHSAFPQNARLRRLLSSLYLRRAVAHLARAVAAGEVSCGPHYRFEPQ